MSRLTLLFVAIVLLCGNVSSQEKLYSNAFSLSDVQLLEGPFKHACELNIEVLLSYDVDRLLAPFLKEAGLPAKAQSFSNWSDLDGHVAGHYLSSLAIHYAATNDTRCKTAMEYVISELKRCQDALGSGYVGAVPGGLAMFEEVKAGHIVTTGGFHLNSKWVPWYNLHKTFAGLRDAWNYAGSNEAKEMFLKLADWGVTIIEPLTQPQMEAMLVVEFGGMCEVYADAYEMTGDIKYLNVAKKFSHLEIFDSMKQRRDNLDNKHANTQVPKAIGYQRVAELTGDADYVTASAYFWETVTQNRSLAFGGNSRREHFAPADKCHEYVEEKEGPESCNTYNMLKLSEGLFRMTHDVKYADYYERAMFNHILSTQHPEHGGYVYFTPARPRHYRVYSDVNKAMWCCVGSGMENHGKYGEFVYTHTTDSLFINLFVASELTWADKNIKVRQETTFPAEEGTKLTLQTNSPQEFSMLIRYPSWVAEGFKIKVNNVEQSFNASPGSYVEIKRTWNDGDVITVETPMRVTVEEMPNVPEYIAFMRGPILLGARTGTEEMSGLVAGDDRWGHIASGASLSLTEAPFIVADRDEILTKLNNMQPVEGNPFHFTVTDLFKRKSDNNLVLEPFYGIHDSRYMMYWWAMTETEYNKVKDEIEETEYYKMQLEERTVDDVKPNEQQPEIDHNIVSQNSTSGYHNGEGWRDASNGYFSYDLLTAGRTDLSLMVRYWGNETGNRTFDILIDGTKLVTESVTGKWNVNEFVNVEYEIPAVMLEGKQSVVVRFQAVANNVAGGVFRVRMLTPKPSKDSFKLSTFISKCEQLMDESEVGTTDGTFPQSAFDELEQKILFSKQLIESEESIQTDVDEQLEVLKQVYQKFYASVNREKELVIGLQFNADNTITDISGNDNAAVYRNNAKTKTMGSYTVADLGVGNGYVDMGQRVGEFIPLLANFSVSVYIHIDKTADISGNGNFVWSFSTHQACGQNEGHYMAYRVNKQRYAMSTAGWGNEIVGLQQGGEAQKDTWHHVVYTQYGTTGKLYIDGVLIEEAKVFNTPTEMSQTVYNWLGRPPFSNDAYLRNTLIYDFQLYNRALSEDEINNKALETSFLQAAMSGVSPLGNVSSQHFKAVGGVGMIHITNPPVGQPVRIYDISGALIHEINTDKTNITVTVSPGVYVAGTEKVIVK